MLKNYYNNYQPCLLPFGRTFILSINLSSISGISQISTSDWFKNTFSILLSTVKEILGLRDLSGKKMIFSGAFSISNAKP